MGRGVSTPAHAIHVVHFDLSWIGQAQEVDDNGDLMYDDNDQPVWVYDELMGQHDWLDWVQYGVKDPLQNKFKSLYEVDKWIGREDHAILANDHCYMGVSSYVQVAAVWVVNWHVYNDAYGSYWASEMALAQAWCERIGKSFRTVLKPDLVKVGTFSNGVSVYSRKEA